MGMSTSYINKLFLSDTIADRSFRSTVPDYDVYHLSVEEKASIDRSMYRYLETERRIETKLILMQRDSKEDVLDPLRFEKMLPSYFEKKIPVFRG